MGDAGGRGGTAARLTTGLRRAAERAAAGTGPQPTHQHGELIIEHPASPGGQAGRLARARPGGTPGPIQRDLSRPIELASSLSNHDSQTALSITACAAVIQASSRAAPRAHEGSRRAVIGAIGSCISVTGVCIVADDPAYRTGRHSDRSGSAHPDDTARSPRRRRAHQAALSDPSPPRCRHGAVHVPRPEGSEMGTASASNLVMLRLALRRGPWPRGAWRGPLAVRRLE